MVTDCNSPHWCDRIDVDRSSIVDTGDLFALSYNWLLGQQTSNEPIAHWRLDETSGITAYDSAGDNDGTLYGGPIWEPNGFIDGALKFDGVDDYVNVPITYHNGQETMCFWIKTTSTELSYFRQVDSSDMYRISLNSSFGGNGTIHVLINNSGTSDWLNGYVSTNVNNGLWNHVAIVTKLATNEIEIYINGVSKTVTYLIQNSLSYPLSFTSTNLFGGPPDRYFEGSADDVRIYDRALSESEIRELAGDRLIAHWKLDETSGTTAADSAGSNDGTLVGDPNWTTGQIDGALELDGVDDHVNLGNDNSIKPALPVTLTAWINMSVVQQQKIISLGETETSPHHGIAFQTITDKHLEVTYGSGQGASGPESRRSKKGTTELNTGNWYHVAAVVRGPTDMDLYINGVNDGGYYEGSGGSLVYSNNNSYIGSKTPTDRFFNGTLDDVRIYNRPLSESEIRKLAGINEPIAHWKLDETSGTTAADSAGSNDGTLYGSPVWDPNGFIDGALSFDGVGQHVLIPDSDSISVGAQDYTISAWINPKPLTGPRGAETIVSKVKDGSDKEYRLLLIGGVLRLDVETNANNQYAKTNTAPVLTDSWQHVAVTFSSSTTTPTFYYNGSAQTSTSNIDTLPDELEDDLYIGMSGGSYYSGEFSGKIDDVRIYNWALTAEEIEQLFGGSDDEVIDCLLW